MLVVSRLSAEFRSIHYAIFFAQNVNTVAIAGLKQEIDKVRRELYGSRSERKARLLEQMELQLEELEADAGEDELVPEIAAKTSAVNSFERKRPS